jgi:hypothetical protein
MKKYLGMLAAIPLLVGLVSPSNAVIVNAVDVGVSGTTGVQGLIDGTSVPGLTGSLFLQFDGLTNGGLTWNFDYTVTNTSSGGIGSRISSFGLNTTPNIASATSTGVYGFPDLSPNGVPGFIGNVDFCFGSSANGCTGGNGLDTGQTASGEFTLTFASMLTAISLDSAYMRFQSITGSNLGSSGAGLNNDLSINPVVAPVPLGPAGPFFATGLAGLWALARRRRKKLDQDLPTSKAAA